MTPRLAFDRLSDDVFQEQEENFPKDYKFIT